MFMVDEVLGWLRECIDRWFGLLAGKVEVECVVFGLELEAGAGGFSDLHVDGIVVGPDGAAFDVFDADVTGAFYPVGAEARKVGGFIGDGIGALHLDLVFCEGDRISCIEGCFVLFILQGFLKCPGTGEFGLDALFIVAGCEEEDQGQKDGDGENVGWPLGGDGCILHRGCFRF